MTEPERQGKPARSELGRVLGTIFGSGAMSIIGMVLALVNGIQLARYMSPESFGVYSGVIAIFFIAMIPPQLGMPMLIIRKLAARLGIGGRDAELSGLLRFAVLAVPATGLVLALVSAGVLQAYGWVAYAAYGIGIICLYPMIAILRGMLVGAGQVTLSQALEQVVRPASFAVALFLMVPESVAMSAHQAMLAHIASLVVTVTCIGLAARHALRRAEIWDTPTYELRAWTRAGMPIVGVEILRSYSAQAAIVLAGLFVVASQLGDLRIAMTIATLYGFPQSVANISVLPTIARLHAAGDRTQLLTVTAFVTVLVSGVQLIGMGIIIAFGEPLIALLFGADYVEAAPLLIILAAGSLGVSLFGPAGTVLLMTHHERSVLVATGLTAIAQTGISLALIPSYGVTGAALGAAGGMILQGALFMLYARKALDYRLDIFSATAQLLRHGVRSRKATE